VSENGYVGVFALGLAIFAGIVGLRKNETHIPNKQIKILWAATLVILIVLSTGDQDTFRKIYSMIPGFGLFRYHSRLLLLSAFTLALLAGWGVEVVRHRLQNTTNSFLVGKSRLVLLLVLLTGTIELLIFAYNQNPTDDIDVWAGDPPSAQYLKTLPLGRIWSVDVPNARFEAYKEAEGWKNGVLPYRDARNQLPNYMNVRYGISTVHNRLFVGLAYARLDALNSFIMGQSPVNALKLAGLFNAQYLLSYGVVRFGDEPIPGLVELRQFPGNIVLASNIHSIPRVYAVGSVKKISSHLSTEEKLSELLHIDRGKEILIESDIPESEVTKQPARQGSAAPFGNAMILNEKRHMVKLSAELPEDGYVVLSDTFYPGWEATVDNVQVPIIQANYVVRAVKVPRGRHIIEFNYRPASFTWGSRATGLGVILFLAVSIVAVVRHRRSTPPSLP